MVIFFAKGQPPDRCFLSSVVFVVSNAQLKVLMSYVRIVFQKSKKCRTK